jgi:hypothetical protein
MESAKNLLQSIDEATRLAESTAVPLQSIVLTKLVAQFVDLNENTFHFRDSSSTVNHHNHHHRDEDGDVVYTLLSQTLQAYLTTSWTSVVRLVNGAGATGNLPAVEDAAEFTSNSSLIIACMNAIRLLSRDKSIIHVFESEPLLNLIQKIANLFILNEPNGETNSIINNIGNSACSLFSNCNSSSNELDLLTLSALKSLSNLIYHSKFIQEFYIRNGVAETITIYLKQFNPVDSFSNSSLKLTKINVMLFNMRILFLLTALNKELRMKLREKLQVITYLIEIIDQIMKERLNDDAAANVNPVELATAGLEQQINSNLPSAYQLTQDFCYLKSIDIDFINEILKILYNLTIDITATGNTSSGNSTNSSNNSTFGVRTANNEEDEAHLMHLVSVLRDLVTCRLEEEFDLIKSTSKLRMLHSNIVNLLTNMPNLCYEELMTPSISGNSSVPNANSPAGPASNNLFKQMSNYSFRLAHNRKRLSRRSKMIKMKQQDGSLSPIGKCFFFSEKSSHLPKNQP